MLQYNEIRMTPDTKHLIVDVSVIDMSYYENVYVGAISIAYIDKEGKQVVLLILSTPHRMAKYLKVQRDSGYMLI